MDKVLGVERVRMDKTVGLTQSCVNGCNSSVSACVYSDPQLLGASRTQYNTYTQRERHKCEYLHMHTLRPTALGVSRVHVEGE